jgi:predicted phosphohydrolase
MHLAWATDVHLNAADSETIAAFCDDVTHSSARALLIGGDIAEAPDVGNRLLDLARRIRLPIYFVLGNHDYYGSSVHAVRESMRRLEHPDLHWLPEAGCVRLTSRTALVGHGGWGDAQVGDFARAPIMTDFLAIEDLARQIDRDDLLDGFHDRGPLQRRLRELGEDAARTLRPHLQQAASGFSDVIALSHVPPFREASWYGGQISDEEWLPHTTCKALGDLLAEVARQNQNVRFRALCGHTHGEGHARIAPNLEAFTRAARYGQPEFVVLEVP